VHLSANKSDYIIATDINVTEYKELLLSCTGINRQ